MAKIAFLFAGQGSQKIGMGKEFYDAVPASQSAFDEIENLREGTLHQMWDGDIEELSKTIHTQPCLFAVNYAVAVALIENGIKPDAVAGFSLGEFPALAVANVLSLKDAFRLVEKRAVFMDEATVGADTSMASIMKLDALQIEEIGKAYNNVYMANYNTKYQTVISGDRGQIEDFIKEVKTRKGSAVKLNTSGAFHSPYMKTAQEKLQIALNDISFSSANCDVYSNVTGNVYVEDDYKKLLGRQIVSPVLWEKTIHQMIDDGVDTFIEMGVGKVLGRMIKKIVKDEPKYHNMPLNIFKVEDMMDFEEVVNNVKQ